MAQAFTATANSNATIGYALYGSSSWSKGSSNGACQGAYQKTTSSGYSANYARVTSITMTVTYEAATVWYRTGGQWVRCAVYYRLNGAWVQVAPYYRSGGAWIQV